MDHYITNTNILRNVSDLEIPERRDTPSFFFLDPPMHLHEILLKINRCYESMRRC
jgi:hypothetical protein